MSASTPIYTNSSGANAMTQSQALGVLCARITSLCTKQWDMNALWQLRKDARDGQMLFKARENVELLSIFNILDDCLKTEQFPDSKQTNMLLLLSQEMQTHGVASVSEIATPIPSLQTENISKRIETPPKAYWRQWPQLNAPSASVAIKNKDIPTATDSPITTTINMTNENKSPAQNAGETSNPEVKLISSRIYHLTDYSKLSIELDLLIENAGMDVELLNSIDELTELLQALPADLVLIDSSFLESFDTISAEINQYQKSITKQIPVVQITESDSNSDLLSAATAAFNACVCSSNGPAAILTQIEQLLRFGKQEQYRVLIVEDDRAQAMFAEGILRNAEIITRVMLNSDTLLQTIEEFLPDLILMDLYMPNASGIELTELIRKSDHFQNTPIVFLSGEIDEDKQVDALEAGGDDFLIKPIRPRRLIAAVQNRIKRHRTMQLESESTQPIISPVREHLIQRSEMLEQLTLDIQNKQKALLFIEISNYGFLEGKLGLTILEKLLKEFSAFLIQTCAPKPLARFSDSAFALIYEGDCSMSVLSAYATKLRVQLMSYKFMAMDEIVDLRIHLGICHFESADDNSDLLVDIAMRTAQIARTNISGIEIFKPKSITAKEREERLIKLISEADSNSCLSHLYQPIVAVGGSAEKQFQCLLRLKDLNGDIVSAAEFIPLAEKNKLIVNIDRWSLTRVTNVILDAVKKNDEIKFFITQSKQTLIDKDQLNWLKNLFMTSQIPANSLVIEINHSDAMHNQQAIQKICNALASERVQFCLSRYNPKNDELNILENLPISYIKLDHKLNLEISLQSMRDEVKALIERAHLLGIEVIGHSVEDAQTAATLWMNGIDFIQGNLIQSAEDSLDFAFDQAVI